MAGSLLEAVQQIEDVQLSLRQRLAASIGTPEGMLLEDGIEMLAVARRGHRLDQLEEDVRARERPESADDAELSHARLLAVAHFGSPSNWPNVTACATRSSRTARRTSHLAMTAVAMLLPITFVAVRPMSSI